MKPVLGVLLTGIGIFGLYLTTTLPSIDASAFSDSIFSIMVEIRRNRIIMSSSILIAGLVLIIDHKKNN